MLKSVTEPLTKITKHYRMLWECHGVVAEHYGQWRLHSCNFCTYTCVTCTVR